MDARRLLLLGLLAGSGLALFGSCRAPDRSAAAPEATPPHLAAIAAELAALPPSVRAAVWAGPAGGEPELAWRAAAPMPAASAIKAALLVELFAAHPEALDRPLPCAALFLGDRSHPGQSHFPAAQQLAAQRALGTATVREIGAIMITGEGVDNATYNLAANLVIAHFDGPAVCSQRLAARPAWQGLAVRRYMLADRTQHGDNEATATALAAVHASLARRHLPGVSRLAIDAARAVLTGPIDALGRATFRKGGSLDSEPVTRVEAGWTEGPQGAYVHVVMLAQDAVPEPDRSAAGERLTTLARDLARRLQFAATPPTK
jgi:hypothetical protein